MALLKGKVFVPKGKALLESLIGKKVEYLRLCDIDYSGRGYFFPRKVKVIAIHNKNLVMEHDTLHIS